MDTRLTGQTALDESDPAPVNRVFFYVERTMQSIVTFIRLFVQLVLKALTAYVQTEQGAREANAVVQAWDMLDGKDDIPDLFGSLFSSFGGTTTPKKPAQPEAGDSPVSGNPEKTYVPYGKR